MKDDMGADEVRYARSMCEVFQDTVRDRADTVALRSSDHLAQMSWAEYGNRVRRITAGLAALGVRPADTVALMLTNRPEFHLVDTAVLHLGAIPFSIYNTSAPEQIDHVFATAGNRVMVCEDQFADRIAKVCEARDVRVIRVEQLADLEATGDPDFAFDAAWQAVSRDDVATLIFTSGTTGLPKAVEITHRGLLYAVSTVLRTPEVLGGRLRGGSVLSYLPDAHMANRLFAHYVPQATGATVVTVRDGRQVIETARDVRPTMFVSVPAIWYKIKAAVEQIGPEQARAALGLDNVVAGISGGAPIAGEAIEFLAARGITVLEGWAMSETSGAGILNPPGRVRPGTVGLAVPGTEIKVAEDGELLVRSPGVMKGYRGEPDKTAAAVDADGWLHTGDLVTVDDDGYVTIVDRKKEIIINAAGKNMSPAAIENAVRTACPLAGSVVAIGDRRPYVVALVTLDPEAAAAFARARGQAEVSAAALAGDPQVQAEVRAGIERANATLSRAEQVKRFTILPDYWMPNSDELTPTLKLKRRVITQKYAPEIDEVYGQSVV